jgi:hypothetical protein
VVDPRTGRHVVVAADDPRSGKQRAVAVGGEPLLPPAPGARSMLAPAIPGTVVASLNAKATREVPALGQEPRVQPSEPGDAWIRFGDTPVTRFGKVMLALAGVEVLWGLMVVTLGLLVLTYGHRPLPVPQLVVGWVAVVLLASVLGAQALTRRVYRRGRMTNVRRWVQGTALTLYTLAVQAAGIYGAIVFQSNQPNPPLAVVSYLLFGISTLLAGAFGLVTALG